MRFILGLIIFWITIFGIKVFIENELKLNKKYSFLFSFTLIGLIEFFLGILNIMKIGSLLIVVSSICYILNMLIKKKINLKTVANDLKNPKNIICTLIFTYITIIGLNMHLTHYDNFSHWGLIVKSIFLNNRLPNFENDYILFKGYQPGSACFIYFFGLLAGKTEISMIIAHNYLIFSYLTVLFNYVGKEQRILKILIVVAFYIFVMTTSLISFNNLLVDSLLAIMLIAGLLIVYEYRKDLKKAIYYSTPIMIYLLVIKNVGLVLSGIICIYILYISYMNKDLKKGVKYISIISLILLATLLIWQGHVSIVYGNLALHSKHSLSAQNIIQSIKTLGIDNILLFIKVYIRHFLSLANNTPNIYMLFLNSIFIALGILSKEKNKIFKFLLVLDILYLGYYVILGLMYIFSMPWEEAKILAGYDRYMMTIINAIIGMSVFFIINNKEKVKFINIIMIVIITLLLIPIKYNYKAFTSLIGNDGYKNSEVERFDKIIDKIPTDKNIYYIYSPSSKGDYGKLVHVSIYKLLKRNCIVIQDEKALKDVKENSYLILFDELDNYDELLKDDYKKINDIVAIKSN